MGLVGRNGFASALGCVETDRHVSRTYEPCSYSAGAQDVWVACDDVASAAKGCLRSALAISGRAE